MERFLSTKFLLTSSMIAGVFALKLMHIDVSDLSLVLPPILAFYIGGNVWQDKINKGNGNG